MRVIKVDPHQDSPEVLTEALEVLRNGGVIVYPTDTLYGLGANALDERAVQRVFDIKRRSASKPLPLLVRNLLWARGLAYLNGRTEKILNAIWPGKVTAIVPKQDIVPDMVTAGLRSVALRAPDFPFLDALLRAFGYPLIGTSANISGEAPSRNLNEIVEAFTQYEARPDLVIDAGTLPESGPSTILDLTTGRPTIVRVGAAKPSQLLELLEV